MKLKELIDQLNYQLENLSELLSVVKSQQISLINNSIDGLDEAVKREEYLFGEINRGQLRVAGLMKTINIDENLRLKELKLSELLNTFPDQSAPEVKILSTIKRRIEFLIKEIGRFNQQNSFLIDHSRDLIKEIISAAASSKNVIFDRRI